MLFLINLDSALARRAAMEAQLQAAGLAAERVGIDLRGATRAHAREMARGAFPAFRFGSLLSAPEIGCWLSHLTAWQRAIDARVPACTAIEDDVVLQPHFAEAHRQLSGEALHDVVYLGTSSRNISMRRPERCGPFQLHRPIGSILNTWGYVLRTEFAARFLAAGGPVTQPIDHVLGGGSRRCRPDVAMLLPPAVRENALVGERVPDRTVHRPSRPRGPRGGTATKIPLEPSGRRVLRGDGPPVLIGHSRGTMTQPGCGRYFRITECIDRVRLAIRHARQEP